ncbi:unnamed protein product [Rhizophagus irregularis]|nr:unnamed protein product [Rhizophagus irregularis]CAB5187702.1 unnamed protein product [Rhizophagus irregularis]
MFILLESTTNKKIGMIISSKSSLLKYYSYISSPILFPPNEVETIINGLLVSSHIRFPPKKKAIYGLLVSFLIWVSPKEVETIIGLLVS